MDLVKSYEVFQPEKRKDRIHIVGCGSVGATLAENLTRLGLTNFTLWDFDKVESHNIANQIFTNKDIGEYKIDALLNIMKEINPDIEEHVELKYKGWQGEKLSGFVFLCVDNIETRQEIVKVNKLNLNISAMFDFRTGLTDAQHYAVDWKDYKMKESFIESMDFTHDEAMEATPMSACHTTLSVCPTIRVIVGIGVANFMNFWNGLELKKMILMYDFGMFVETY